MKPVNAEQWDPVKRVKLCTHCGEWKSLDDYYRSDRTGSGCRYACKECYVHDQTRREKGLPSDHVSTSPYQIVQDDGTKLCSVCKLVKPAEESFYKKPNGHYHAHCSACQTEKVSRWRVKNGLPALKGTYKRRVRKGSLSPAKISEVKRAA